MKNANLITAYRPCVGVMLLNEQSRIWIGRRYNKQSDDGSGLWWQMPQGGIDKDEPPEKAALRELREETSVTSAQVIGEAPDWYHYDLPEELIGISWKGKYRGQKQKWFALRFTGQESEINLAVAGQKPEFDQWRWATPDEVMAMIVPFKKHVYAQVFQAFHQLGLI